MSENTNTFEHDLKSKTKVASLNHDEIELAIKHSLGYATGDGISIETTMIGVNVYQNNSRLGRKSAPERQFFYKKPKNERT